MKHRSGGPSSSSEAPPSLPAAVRALRCTRIAGQRSKRHNPLRDSRSLTTRKPKPAAAHRRSKPLGGSGRKPERPMPEFSRLGRRDFPGRFAGASLKLICVVGFASVASPFPRQIRRGLIEASSHSSDPGSAVVVRRLSSSERFPRQIRRGLIEAKDAIHRFPRQIRRGLIEAPPFGRDFPGRFAGASLKRPPAALSSVFLGDISPADSPGPH